MKNLPLEIISYRYNHTRGIIKTKQACKIGLFFVSRGDPDFKAVDNDADLMYHISMQVKLPYMPESVLPEHRE